MKMSEQKLEAIRKIKKTHENLVVAIGITIGLILGVYFFSFASLIDSARPFAIQFLMVTTVLLVVALIYVKRIALFFTRLLLGRKAECKAVLSVLAVADLAKDEETLLQQLS
jgi:hypothetical protein